jgi:hypothetical protein
MPSDLPANLLSDGNLGDGETYRLKRDINIKAGRCIDIDATTLSIFVAKGTGLVWRRKMTAYGKVYTLLIFDVLQDNLLNLIQAGCPRDQRLRQFEEHEHGDACFVVVDLLGMPPPPQSRDRADQSGFIRSVRFDGF